jgi:hypothetical protein
MFDRKPRNIIAKFTKYTDHEKVRTAAFEKLKGRKDFVVFQQYPADPTKNQVIFHRVGLHFKRLFPKFYAFPLDLVFISFYGRHPSFYNIIVKFPVRNSL